MIDNLKIDELKNNTLEGQNKYLKYEESQILEDMIKNDPLFDLINQHKKKLQEIKEWQTNFTNENVIQTEITTYDNDKLKNNQNILNNNKNIISDIKTENKNNIKSAKDFLKLNSINQSQSIIENNNDDSSININIKKNINEYNSNDNSISITKDFGINDNENEKNQKFVKTGTNFNKKLELEKIKNINNCHGNNTNLRRSNYTTSRINNNINNNKSLEFKLEKKKIEIKNLEASIDLLTKENRNLKRYIYELESKIDNYQLDNKTNIFNHDNIISREQEMFKKINSLTKEIQEKNNQIEKLKSLDEQLTEKCRELDLFSKENALKVENLMKENNNYKVSIQATEKIIFTINYFIKKIYNIIPCLSNGEIIQDIQEPLDLQKHLIIIENFINEYIIYNSNQKSKFLLDFGKNKNNKERDKEKDELEKKINEINKQNIFLLKEIQGRKKPKKKKSNNSSKNKKIINRTNSKNKK